VRHRRLDLAVLMALGCQRRQIAAAISWHATTVAAIGLMVGVPLGLVGGRLAFAALTEAIDVRTVHVLPVSVGFAAIGAILLANLVAFGPASTAARTRPSRALQIE
jgi:ABC-type lipoprotein release transport system permease subunit